MRHGENRSADYHRIRSTQDAAYYSAGIPFVYWKAFTESPFFLPINGNEGYNQQAKFNRLQNSDKIFDKNHLIYVGAEDEDSASLIVYEWMKRALFLNCKIQITDSALIKEEHVEDETVFMLTNLFHKCTSERIMHSRDWIFRHKDCFRILVMACDPYDFAQQVRVKASAMFNLNVIKTNTKEYS